MPRRVLLALGLLALAAAWLTGLPQMAQRAFWAHMTMHMTVVAVAAPLITLGLAGTRFDPVRWAPALFAPIPASIVELIIVWAWHAPALHHAARHDAVGLIAEQGMFLTSGLLVWLSAFGGYPRSVCNCVDGTICQIVPPPPASRDNQSVHVIANRSKNDKQRSGAGVVGLLLTSTHMTLLGALLALAPRPLYSHIEGGAHLTSLDDQHLGGAIMLLVGGVAYLSGGLGLMAGLLRGAALRSGEKA